MAEGVDYSTARPSPAHLYAAGKRFVCRYMYGTTIGKALTTSERKALHAAGLSVVLNWEFVRDEATGGYDRGVERARRAKAILLLLGAPDSAAVYFSVDYDTRGTDLQRERAYFQGIISVLPKWRVGIYGGKHVIDAAIREHWCSYFWQTYAWSGGQWNRFNHIEQYHNGFSFEGHDVDLDRSKNVQYGQWEPGGPVTDVALTNDQDNALGRAYQAAHALITGRVETVAAGDLPSGESVWIAHMVEDLADMLGVVLGKVSALATPTVDPGLLAAALTENTAFIDAVASAIASKIVTRGGTISLSGQLSGTLTPAGG